MKNIKLPHDQAVAVRAGDKTSLWLVFDDKDLSVDDRVVLIDKVDPRDHNSWVAFGEAVIERLVEKHLSAVGHDDFESGEPALPPETLLERLRQQYGGSVSLKTPVKIISVRFYPYKQTTAVADKSVHTTASLQEVKLYADGGSRGNPGPSASGYVLFDMEGAVIEDEGVFLGVTTNNQAEYTALKLGLEAARSHGARIVHVYMDSMLVVNQMKGIFKVKNRDLWPIHDAITRLAVTFQTVTFTHVPRELNKAADAAVNRALDARVSDSDRRQVV